MGSHGEWRQYEAGIREGFLQKMKFKQRFQRHQEGPAFLGYTRNASTWETEAGGS